MKKIIILKDICSGSILPEHGKQLFKEIQKNIRCKQIFLSLEGFEIMSQSFLNASLCLMISLTSKAFVRNKIALINCRPSHYEYIKNYVENY